MGGYFWNYELDPEFPLSILEFTTYGDIDRIHWHNYLEIGLCTGGSGKFIFTNKEYDVKKGDVFIVSNFENHVAISELPTCTDYIFVIFLPDFIASPGSRHFDFEYLYPFRYNSKTFNNKLDGAMPETKAIGERIEGLKDVWDRREAGYRHILDANLRMILALLIKYYKTTYAEYYSISAHSQAKIHEALYYINQNFNRGITLNELAERFHISESRFRHLFKETIRMGFKEYITYLRLTESRKLLLTTDLNINDIAGNAGYTNINQFYKMFYKYVFMSPAEYRKHYRHNAVK